MGAKVTNLVLYAVAEGARRPLVSLSVSDEKAPKLSALEVSAKMNAACVAEFSRCERQGVPHPALRFVRETRQADEQGRLIFSEYCDVDQQGRDDGTPVQELDALFAAKAADHAAQAAPVA